MKIIEGQPWPKPPLAVVGSFRKALLGPNSPRAVALDWHRIPQIPKVVAQGWPKIDSEPTAQPWWPRGWRYGAALGIKASFADEIKRSEPTARPGAAYLSMTGNVIAGIIPDGHDFGEIRDDELGGDFYTLIARMRPIARHTAPIFIVPETSRVIVPAEVRFLDGGLAIGNLALLDLVGNPVVV